MRILIVTGGHVDVSFSKKFLQHNRFDRVIAADAGLASCREIGCCPTDILGDFDSLKNLELREEYRKKGIPIREFPTRKDYTDTHLAILYAIDLWNESLSSKIDDHKIEEAGIWVLGASGTRFDHSLANVGLMVLLADQKIPCVMLDAHNEMEILKGPVEKRYRNKGEKTFFSLLPFSKTVRGIDLIGFSYPLENAELKAFESMGISNEIIQEYGTVRIKDGYMLVVQACD